LLIGTRNSSAVLHFGSEAEVVIPLCVAALEAVIFEGGSQLRVIRAIEWDAFARGMSLRSIRMPASLAVIWGRVSLNVARLWKSHLESHTGYA
jgi:hypothetical protein